MWMKKKKKIQWGLETFGQLKKSFADLNRPTGGSFSPPVSIPQAPVSIRSHLLSIEYLFSVYYVEHSDHCNYFPFPVVLFNKAAGRISYLRIFFYTETIKQTDPVSLFLFFLYLPNLPRGWVRVFSFQPVVNEPLSHVSHFETFLS